jgi:23S rRNA pseudouridine1911/1915/1917 synthase
MVPGSRDVSSIPIDSTPLQVLYEDNHVIAVFKPAGLLTQGDRTGDMSLLELTRKWLKEKYAKPGNVFLGLVHRLDRPVAGVVVFGKTSKGASRLSESFRRRTVVKEYWAVVEGAPPKAEGRLEDRMDWPTEGKAEILLPGDDRPGKMAVLDYRVLQRGTRTSLVEIHLGTGRKHQIRAQLAHLGTPIVGDQKYGARTTGDVAMGLICRRLEWDHPVKEERVSVSVPESITEDLKRWVK